MRATTLIQLLITIAFVGVVYTVIWPSFTAVMNIRVINTINAFISRSSTTTNSTSVVRKSTEIRPSDLFFTLEILQDSYRISRSLLEYFPEEYRRKGAESCDAECFRLRRVLFSSRSWPTNKPKAVIYILTHRTDRLPTTLMQLDTNFNRRFKYPVVLFHEGYYDDENRRQNLKHNISSDIIFQRVQLTTPSFREPLVQVSNSCCCFGIGYKHMCRFHSFQVYLQEVFRGVDYYWRLDDDSEILSPIDFDVFQFMDDNNLTYGYTIALGESPGCILGLYQATKFFQNITGNDHNIFQVIPRLQVVYNNFEISAVSMWLSKEYIAYLAFLDALDGIYSYRWGDAPIKTVAVQLFVRPRQIYKFNSSQIKYKHGIAN